VKRSRAWLTSTDRVPFRHDLQRGGHRIGDRAQEQRREHAAVIQLLRLPGRDDPERDRQAGLGAAAGRLHLRCPGQSHVDDPRQRNGVQLRARRVGQPDDPARRGTGSYDKNGELTSATLSGTSYSYNADGQRQSAVLGGAAIASGTWNGAAQVTSYDNAAAAPSSLHSGSYLSGIPTGWNWVTSWVNGAWAQSTSGQKSTPVSLHNGWLATCQTECVA
jgi:hypothetical protein